MKKYDIDKFSLENKIFYEVSENSGVCDTKVLHEKIVNLLSEELSEYVNEDEIIDELVEKGAFKQLNISQDDLKKMAVNNLVIDIVKRKQELINSTWNLMPLANINFEVIQEETYDEMLDNLNLQLTSIIENPIYKVAMEVVEEALKDGEIFAELIKGEENIIKFEQKIKDKADRDFNRSCKKNIAMYKTYKEGETQSLLINSIAKKITEKKLISSIEDNVRYNEKIKKDIDEKVKKVELYMNDVENVIYSKRYKRVLRKVPDDELLDLIQISSSLNFKKTNPTDNVHQRKKLKHY